jgi:hypothetical protein
MWRSSSGLILITHEAFTTDRNVAIWIYKFNFCSVNERDISMFQLLNPLAVERHIEVANYNHWNHWLFLTMTVTVFKPSAVIACCEQRLNRVGCIANLNRRPQYFHLSSGTFALPCVFCVEYICPQLLYIRNEMKWESLKYRNLLWKLNTTSKREFCRILRIIVSFNCF